MGFSKLQLYVHVLLLFKKKKISIHTNKILTVKSSEEYVPLNHRGVEGCLYSVNWVQMCTTVMN